MMNKIKNILICFVLVGSMILLFAACDDSKNESDVKTEKDETAVAEITTDAERKSEEVTEPAETSKPDEKSEQNKVKKSEDPEEKKEQSGAKETETAVESVKDADESKSQASGDAQKKYEAILADGLAGLNGKVTYGLHMYDSGVKVINGDSKMKSASVIKLFIMEYAFDRISKGEITPASVVSGRELMGLIEDMIIYSDNEATNILINHFGMDKINSFLTANGYSNTVVQRRMLDTAAASRGEENYTSVSDVMMFLDKLYNNQGAYPYGEMLDIMKSQQVATKLRRDMPQNVIMASKTGELSDVENDVAIVFADKGAYAIVCLTQDCDSSSARNAMATTCRKIYDAVMAE